MSTFIAPCMWSTIGLAIANTKVGWYALSVLSHYTTSVTSPLLFHQFFFYQKLIIIITFFSIIMVKSTLQDRSGTGIILWKPGECRLHIPSRRCCCLLSPKQYPASWYPSALQCMPILYCVESHVSALIPLNHVLLFDASMMTISEQYYFIYTKSLQTGEQTA